MAPSRFGLVDIVKMGMMTGAPHNIRISYIIELCVHVVVVILALLKHNVMVGTFKFSCDDILHSCNAIISV